MPRSAAAESKSEAGIIDACVEQGREAFASGAPLRSIVERLQAADDDDQLDQAMSIALGFAEALVDKLRSL